MLGEKLLGREVGARELDLRLVAPQLYCRVNGLVFIDNRDCAIGLRRGQVVMKRYRLDRHGLSLRPPLGHSAGAAPLWSKRMTREPTRNRVFP
jgi:hypothetical protein